MLVPNALKMWKAIERLKQGESINVQDLETNLYREFGKFTSRDGESLESSYFNTTRIGKGFVTLVKQSQELKTISYHKLYDILKQHQNEVNEIRAERQATRANQDNSPRINRGTGYDNQRAVNVAGARENVENQNISKDAAYHKEKMLLCKQEEAEVQLNAEQADWKDDTDG
ncbi:hypothetical protein Tco_1255787 [Tanacetum coccineum]